MINLKDQIPNILFGVGTLGHAGSIALAGPTYMKLCAILDDESLTKREKRIKILKLYGPLSFVSILSLVCFAVSYRTVNKKYAALLTAYSVLNSDFLNYRKDTMQYLQPTERTELKMLPAVSTSYSVVFDSSHNDWSDNKQNNLVYFQGKQDLANELNQTKGHILLNEVFDILGFPRTNIGSQVGWLYTDEIIFRIRDCRTYYIINFEVTGYVFDKIESYQFT